MFKVRNSILVVGLLVSFIVTGTVLYRIHVIEKELEFNRYWMIVKRVRADEHQIRIERLERALSEQKR